jgi:hypothetical protein
MDKCAEGFRITTDLSVFAKTMRDSFVVALAKTDQLTIMVTKPQ